MNRYQWEEALTSCPGVYFDFQGDIPLQVLVGWLSGEESALDAHVRRLVLSLWQNQVAFYYQDQRDGYYYRCLTEVVTPQQLESALTGMGQYTQVLSFPLASSSPTPYQLPLTRTLRAGA